MATLRQASAVVASTWKDYGQDPVAAASNLLAFVLRKDGPYELISVTFSHAFGPEEKIHHEHRYWRKRD